MSALNFIKSHSIFEFLLFILLPPFSLQNKEFTILKEFFK